MEGEAYSSGMFAWKVCLAQLMTFSPRRMSHIQTKITSTSKSGQVELFAVIS